MTAMRDHEWAEHPWPRRLDTSSIGQVVVVISDVEMGAGGTLDDFPQTDYLADLLLGYGRGAFASVPVTFVFAGDTFDLLKVPLRDGTFPSRIDAAVGVEKMDRVIETHRPLFDALRQVVDGADAARRLTFVAGNHDQELFFPEVQQRIVEAIGRPEAIDFPGTRVTLGDVRIEHGSQRDPMFAVDESQPFVLHRGRRLLNIPWGTLALLEVAMPYLGDFHQLDRLRPRRRVFQEIPELRELMIDRYWAYWTRDYWTPLLADGDPLRRVSWRMVREVVYRLGTGDPELSMIDARRILLESSDVRTLVMGHQHEPGWWSLDDRRFLQTGCFRNEYLLDLETHEHRLLPKVYAEVFLDDAGRTARARLVEVDAPPPPWPAVPRTLDAARALAGRRLSELSGDRTARTAARHAHEHSERGRESPGVPGFVSTLRQLLDRRSPS